MSILKTEIGTAIPNFLDSEVGLVTQTPQNPHNSGPDGGDGGRGGICGDDAAVFGHAACEPGRNTGAAVPGNSGNFASD